MINSGGKFWTNACTGKQKNRQTDRQIATRTEGISQDIHFKGVIRQT